MGVYGTIRGCRVSSGPVHDHASARRCTFGVRSAVEALEGGAGRPGRQVRLDLGILRSRNVARRHFGSAEATIAPGRRTITVRAMSTGQLRVFAPEATSVTLVSFT